GNNDWSIFLARPLRGEGGRFMGVVVATIPLRYFRDFYRETELGEGAIVSLWRDDGTLLVRHPLRDGDAADSPETGLAADGLTPDWRSGLVRVLSGPDAAPAIAAQRHLRNYPLIMSVAMTEEAIFAQWRSQSMIIGSAAMAGIIVIGLVAV